MTIFTQYEEKPITPKRKLLIIALVFTIVPAWAWIYGKHEYKHSDLRRASLPVEVALPAELEPTTPSNIYDF